MSGVVKQVATVDDALYTTTVSFFALEKRPAVLHDMDPVRSLVINGNAFLEKYIQRDGGREFDLMPAVAYSSDPEIIGSVCWIYLKREKRDDKALRPPRVSVKELDPSFVIEKDRVVDANRLARLIILHERDAKFMNLK